jgi:3-isopropylmalate/(R)-2-methylmalate dehydratase small subunit
MTSHAQIPGAFLTGFIKTGLGEQLARFADRAPDSAPAVGARFADPGRRRELRVRLARGHAPWALVDRGFRAIIARSFGDIFRQNALKNGLLPIALDAAAHARVIAARAADPQTFVRVDLPAQRVSIAGDPTASFGFPIDPFARHCLIHGVDELGYSAQFEDRITAYERRQP